MQVEHCLLPVGVVSSRACFAKTEVNALFLCFGMFGFVLKRGQPFQLIDSIPFVYNVLLFKYYYVCLYCFTHIAILPVEKAVCLWQHVNAQSK